jgi:hypothetical protein
MMGQNRGPGGPGGPGRPGRYGPARADQDTDPLGRPTRGRADDAGPDNNCVATDSPSCLPLRRRAEEILNELRRRFGETFRPQIELDYIERLLKDY